MWSWVITNIIISLTIILVLHSLFQSFKETYTVKKTKDLVGVHTQKYKTMLKDLQDQYDKQQSELVFTTPPPTPPPPPIINELDDDLNQFIVSELIGQ